MSNKKRKNGLNGYTELYKKGIDGRADVYFTITRHMASRHKTYFMYWFNNPRNGSATRDSREPDVYRYFFRIRWDKGGLLQKHEQPIINGHSQHGKWKDCNPTSDFNLFPNYREMVDKIKTHIVEHEILTDFTDSKETI